MELANIRGGSSILQAQANCPFRAFASQRLQLEPLGATRAGLSPADRGSILHNALYALWGELENSDKLQEILDSIKDDLAVIQDNLEEARKKVTDSGNPNQLKEKAEYMEGILTIDPEDMNLRSQVANAWYAWGNPAPHGNGCDRAEGIKKAIPHYERILEIFPNNTAFLLAMGRCYQALEDSKHARGYYEKVIELDGTKGSGPTAKALIRNMDQNDANRANKGK